MSSFGTQLRHWTMSLLDDRLRSKSRKLVSDQIYIETRQQVREHVNAAEFIIMDGVWTDLIW
jgi:hypothetical protein